MPVFLIILKKIKDFLYLVKKITSIEYEKRPENVIFPLVDSFIFRLFIMEFIMDNFSRYISLHFSILLSRIFFFMSFISSSRFFSVKTRKNIIKFFYFLRILTFVKWNIINNIRFTKKGFFRVATKSQCFF